MTRRRHTEEQIIAVLKDAQAGIGVQELCRKHGISDATFYKWRAKYVGLEVSDVKKLRQLEDENRRLKQMVAEQALDIDARRMPPCGRGSARWPRASDAMAVPGSLSGCGAKAGRSTIRRWSAFIATKGCHCGDDARSWQRSPAWRCPGPPSPGAVMRWILCMTGS